MLSRPRVIFFQFQLFRLGAWVLFGHVKIASVGCANEFDLKGRWLRHDAYSLMPCVTCRPNASTVTLISAQTAVKYAESQACISVFLICRIVAFLFFCGRMMMKTADARHPTFVLGFCQFCRHPPNPAGCPQKLRLLR